MFMALLRDSTTVQGVGGILLGMSALFSGIQLRPQNINPFWRFLYFVLPGHYYMEGLVVSQFHEDSTQIQASVGSPFYAFLECNSKDTMETMQECHGSAQDWIAVSFGGVFAYENLPLNVLYLVGVTVVCLLVSYIALVKCNYLSK
jgi:ABC-type multidrug transport system permease subunit